MKIENFRFSKFLRFSIFIDFPLKIFAIFEIFLKIFEKFYSRKSIFNFSVFKYFFDRSFLKIQATEELSFHHRENAANAMRGNFFRKCHMGIVSRLKAHICLFSRYQIRERPHVLIHKFSFNYTFT